MVVMSFDLSSVCIGLICARLDGKGIANKVMSAPIIPKQFSPICLGYKASKKKLKTKSGELLNTYWKDGEVEITKVEKAKRDKEVRAKKDIYVLEYIGKQMGDMIDRIKPDLILVEKNAAFNGILTTVLLAKVMGSLLGIAGYKGIPVVEYPVSQVRAHHNVAKLVKEFVKGKTQEELQALPDITKAALRELMYNKYKDLGILFQTDDESDACVVFDYWYEIGRKA